MPEPGGTDFGGESGYNEGAGDKQVEAAIADAYSRAEGMERADGGNWFTDAVSSAGNWIADTALPKIGGLIGSGLGSVFGPLGILGGGVGGQYAGTWVGDQLQAIDWGGNAVPIDSPAAVAVVDPVTGKTTPTGNASLDPSAPDALAGMDGADSQWQQATGGGRSVNFDDYLAGIGMQGALQTPQPGQTTPGVGGGYYDQSRFTGAPQGLFDPSQGGETVKSLVDRATGAPPALDPSQAYTTPAYPAAGTPLYGYGSPFLGPQDIFGGP